MSSVFLVILLFALLLGSAFFSSAETSMMALNRYRMRDKARKGQRSAILAERLINKPDSMLGTILLCNNLFNNAATAVTTLLALRWFGEEAVAIATGLITLVILLVAEVPPKTVAAVYPDRIAYPASYVLSALRVAVGPLVTMINISSQFVLRHLGIKVQGPSNQSMSLSEIRLAVHESQSSMPSSVNHMLMGVLDIESITVEDVMVPRNQMEAIDLDQGFKQVMHQLATVRHTRIPLYRQDINQMQGYVHMRQLHQQHARAGLSSEEELLAICQQAPYILGESLLSYHLSSLGVVDFAFVIDEYGDLLGIVDHAAITERVFGRLADVAHSASLSRKPAMKPDSVVVSAGMEVDELEQRFGIELPNPNKHRTVNGLIVNTLEEIPKAGDKLLLGSFECEILRSDSTRVYTLRMSRQTD